MCRVTNSPVFLLTSKDAPFESVEDVVAAAEAEPGGLAYGTPAPGSIPHLVVLAFNDAMDIEMKHVPHQGSADVFRSLACGVVKFYANIPVDIESGDLKPSSSSPTSATPDTPTCRRWLSRATT